MAAKQTSATEAVGLNVVEMPPLSHIYPNMTTQLARCGHVAAPGERNYQSVDAPVKRRWCCACADIFEAVYGRRP